VTDKLKMEILSRIVHPRKLKKGENACPQAWLLRRPDSSSARYLVIDVGLIFDPIGGDWRITARGKCGISNIDLPSREPSEIQRGCWDMISLNLPIFVQKLGSWHGQEQIWTTTRLIVTCLVLPLQATENKKKWAMYIRRRTMTKEIEKAIKTKWVLTRVLNCDHPQRK